MHLAEAALPLICVAAATAGHLVQDLLVPLTICMLTWCKTDIYVSYI